MAEQAPRPGDGTAALAPGWVTAPDGIPVRPIPLPGGGLIGLAEGRIPPGRYGVHVHYSLEQVTYVISGRVQVRMGSPHEEVELGRGDAALTEPGRTLSFDNHGPEEAVVLFICAPPYPADDSDTGRPPEHGPLGGEDRKEALRRQQAALSAIQCLLGARLDRMRGGQ